MARQKLDNFDYSLSFDDQSYRIASVHRLGRTKCGLEVGGGGEGRGAVGGPAHARRCQDDGT